MFSSRRLTILALLAVALLFGPGVGHATTLESMNFRELASRSTTIVHGTVVSSDCRWNDARSMIFTHVQVQVGDVLRGSPGGIVEVLVPGGSIGKLQVEIPGTPVYTAGQETVLFLAPDDKGALHVNGLSLGRFDVVADAATGRKMVRGLPVDALQIIRGDTAGMVSTSSSVTGGPLPLDAVLDGIRNLVRDLPVREGN